MGSERADLNATLNIFAIFVQSSQRGSRGRLKPARLFNSSPNCATSNSSSGTTFPLPTPLRLPCLRNLCSLHTAVLQFCSLLTALQFAPPHPSPRVLSHTPPLHRQLSRQPTWVRLCTTFRRPPINSGDEARERLRAGRQTGARGEGHSDFRRLAKGERWKSKGQGAGPGGRGKAPGSGFFWSAGW